MAIKINDASNFGAMPGQGRQVVRDSNGYLFALVHDPVNYDLEMWTPANVDTYYFDGSDVPATDAGSDWTDVTNVDDGSTSTFMYTTTDSTSIVTIQGTNASGTENIVGVRARIYGKGHTGIGYNAIQAKVYTDGKGETLGTAATTLSTAAWSSYVNLTTPSGGWTWDKLAALEAEIYVGNGDNAVDIEAYRVEIEVTSQSKDGTDTWVELDEGATYQPNTNGTTPPCSIAIDSTDKIHVAFNFFPTADQISYTTFSSGAWSGSSIEGIKVGSEADWIDIAVDSNDVPHVVTSYSSTHFYNNRVGGSWGTDLVLTASSGGPCSISINASDVPIIGTIDTFDGFAYAFLGNQNDAGSFSSNTLDSSVNTSADQMGVSIAVDSAGDAWITYIDSDSSLVLAKQSTNWTDAWTLSDSGITAYEPSLVINGTDKHIFYYLPISTNIGRSLYDGSWNNYDDLGAGSYEDAKARWASATQYDSGGNIVSSLRTYYFNGSDASASNTGSGTDWSTVTNADDGDVDTDATVTLISFQDAKELLIEGTNAPASGGTISQVRARVYGSITGGGSNFTDITTDGDAEEIATNIPAPATEGWSDYVTLSTPTGGWTWAKVQGLESRSRATGGVSGSDATLSRIEILVQTSDSPLEIDYLFSDGTDVYWNELTLEEAPEPFSINSSGLLIWGPKII